MKKTALILSALIIAILLCACATEKEPQKDSVTPANDGQAVTDNSLEALSENDSQAAADDSLEALSEGEKYLYVNNFYGGIYKDGDTIYYANTYDYDKLYKYDTVSNTSTLLVDDIEKVMYIRVYNDSIYFTGISRMEDYGEDFEKYHCSIFKVNKDGSDLELIVDNAMNSIISDGYLYFIDQPKSDYMHSVSRIKLKTADDVPEKETIIGSDQFPIELADEINIVGDRIYYYNYDEKAIIEYCISTKEAKELAHDEYGLKQLQYFDGALYYTNEWGDKDSKELVHKIDLETYEDSVELDFLELYEFPEGKEFVGSEVTSMNVTAEKIFINGAMRTAGQKGREWGTFIYNRADKTLTCIDVGDDKRLVTIFTYVTDDAVFYVRSWTMDMDGITVLDHNGNDISEMYSGMIG